VTEPRYALGSGISRLDTLELRRKEALHDMNSVTTLPTIVAVGPATAEGARMRVALLYLEKHVDVDMGRSRRGTGPALRCAPVETILSVLV